LEYQESEGRWPGIFSASKDIIPLSLHDITFF
jgi:hypothetical protein